jgi:hypothetical protein
MRCIYLRKPELVLVALTCTFFGADPRLCLWRGSWPIGTELLHARCLDKPRPSAEHSDRFRSNSGSILPKVSCRVTLKWVGSNSRLFYLGLPCSTRLRHRATLQWGGACDDHLTGKTRVKMKPKASKAKERRHANELTLVEQRRGRLWTYAQVPVCATLVLCLLRLVQ